MQQARPVRLHHRLALVVIAAVLLLLLAQLPPVVRDTLQTMQSFRSPNFSLSASGDDATPVEPDLHIELVSLDDVQRMVTLRVSGHRLCSQGARR